MQLTSLGSGLIGLFGVLCLGLSGCNALTEPDAITAVPEEMEKPKPPEPKPAAAVRGADLANAQAPARPRPQRPAGGG